MQGTFRKSMTWLHTWAGVVIGSVLFAIFWMGTLSVFDREIDRWMQPDTRLQLPVSAAPLDTGVVPVASELARGSTQWGLTLPTERVPVYRLFYATADGERSTRHLHPESGALIDDQGSEAGTGFIFPFHFMLHLKWLDIGYWLVGLAGMSMLVLLVSGVVIHKKIFADFFTFRPRKALQRSSLDLHNLSGVVALPFHFMIALSGLIIFMNIYFPQAHLATYGKQAQARAEFQSEAYGQYIRDKSEQPGAVGSIDSMLAQAEHEWQGGKPYFIRVWHPGDANSYVEVRRAYANDITMHLDTLYFDASSGEVLKRFAAGPVMTVQRFISGLHFIQFEHWPLRWLYFIAGIAGCVMIATGFLFWLGARRASHAKKGLPGVRIVEGLTIGSVSGIVLATLAMLVANRLLPLGFSVAGMERAEVEILVFYLAWLATFAHAWLWPAKAWREQVWGIAALSLACPLLNAWSTGDHILRSLADRQWAVAGVDIALILTAVLAVWVARRLGQPAREPLRRTRKQAAELRHE